MKTKELKNIAKKIVKCELIINNSEDPAVIKQAENEIMKISGSVKSLEDMMIIDEMVQELLGSIS